jgi:hypothetical protein
LLSSDKTASSSLERGPFVSIQGKEASSRPGETPSAHMVAVRTFIRQRGFSEKATMRIREDEAVLHTIIVGDPGTKIVLTKPEL